MKSCFIEVKPHNPLEIRFWRFVDKKTKQECWNWLGQKIRGYGRISVGKRGQSSLGAHRYSWQIFNKQEIPKGFHVMHKCDNPSCVNPLHLVVGTAKNNYDDMVKKGRRVVVAPVGKNNGKSVINENVVKEIRASNLSHAALARKHNVSVGCIRGVRSKRTWKHIE